MFTWKRFFCSFILVSEIYFRIVFAYSSSLALSLPERIGSPHTQTELQLAVISKTSPFVGLVDLETFFWLASSERARGKIPIAEIKY